MVEEKKRKKKGRAVRNDLGELRTDPLFSSVHSINRRREGDVVSRHDSTIVPQPPSMHRSPREPNRDLSLSVEGRSFEWENSLLLLPLVGTIRQDHVLDHAAESRRLLRADNRCPATDVIVAVVLVHVLSILRTRLPVPLRPT